MICPRFAFALRFDVPRGITLGDFFPFFRGKEATVGAACKRNCQSTLDTFKLARVAVYFATGTSAPAHDAAACPMVHRLLQSLSS